MKTKLTLWRKTYFTPNLKIDASIRVQLSILPEMHHSNQF